MIFIPDSDIEDTEKLYRSIRPYDQLWDSETNKPSSAAFIDGNGVSVDRDGNRIESEIISALDGRSSSNDGIAILTAKQCREVEAHPIPKPILEVVPCNPYHAEIHDSATKVRLSKGKARSLSKIAVIIRNHK